ncbi:MAG: hypothetical protein IKP00_02300 [Victivallales bacterium]|nr:hypothetical protein [Victivallales bacterium]
MNIRTGMMSIMAASAFICFGAFAAEPAKPAVPAKNDEVPDCCKPDFLKAPATKDALKPTEATAPAMGGCKKGGMGGCGGHGPKEGGMMPQKSGCDSSTITLVLPCGHDVKIIVGDDNKPTLMGGHGPKEGGCGGQGPKEGGCGGHGAMMGGHDGMGGCGGHGGMGGCKKGGMGGCKKDGMGGCKQAEKKPEAPTPPEAK